MSWLHVKIVFKLITHTHHRYLLEVNRWKERHNEKSRELRMILIEMPSQVKEVIELENKQPDEVVHWDSPEKECSPAASKSRDRSPLKPLQLGNSWSQGKWISSYRVS